jgi:hypothetical protein
MRGVGACLVGFIVATGLWGQAPGGDKPVVRFRIIADYDKYPQDKPNVALASVVKAIQLDRIDYLLAHLADPAFVDKRVQEYKAQVTQNLSDEGKTLLAFDRLVTETGAHFKADPTIVKDLQQFAKSAEWETKDSTAEAQWKGNPARRVFMKKINPKWYLEDRQN